MQADLFRENVKRYNFPDEKFTSNGPQESFAAKFSQFYFQVP